MLQSDTKCVYVCSLHFGTFLIDKKTKKKPKHLQFQNSIKINLRNRGKMDIPYGTGTSRTTIQQLLY